MFQPSITDAEVTYRHQQIRAQFIESQSLMSVAGIRHLIGNSIIAFGDYIYGKAQESCQEAAETRAQIRATMRQHRTHAGVRA